MKVVAGHSVNHLGSVLPWYGRGCVLLQYIRWPLGFATGLVLISFMMGVGYALWRSAAVLAESLPDRTVSVLRFKFKVAQSDLDFPVSSRIQLSVWNTHADADDPENFRLYKSKPVVYRNG